MASRFLVATGLWSSTTVWSATSGGAAGASVPVATDDVFLNAASGIKTLTIDAGSVDVCQSLNCTGFTGTLVHSGTTLTIGSATAGAGNVALLLVSSMVYSVSSALLSFVSTSTTQQTIAGGTRGLSGLTINGAGSSYLLSDSLSVAGTVTLTAGTINTNNLSHSWTAFVSSGAVAKTITLGTSAMTIQGWTSTGVLTITANTAVITGTATSVTYNMSTISFNGASIVFASTVTTASCLNAVTCAALTYNAGAVKTSAFQVSGGSLVVTGALTLNGQSVINRIQVIGAPVGGLETITAGSLVTSNTDWQDIKGAGAANWDLHAITGNSGDCGGNSGITFTASVAQTWAGTASGAWSTNAWTTRVPLPQDDVSLGVAFVAGRTITLDMPRAGRSLSYVGMTGAPVMSFSGFTIYGSLTMIPGQAVGNAAVTMAGRGAYTLTNAGNTINALVLNAPGGSLTLQDDLTIGTVAVGARLTVSAGTFNSNNFNITASNTGACYVFTAGAFVNMGTSTWTAVGGGTNPVANGVASGFATATLVIAGASAVLRTITTNNSTFGAISYNVPNSPGALALGGTSVTIGTLTIGPGCALTLQASSTVTVTNWNVQGQVNGYQYLPGVAGNNASTPDSPATSITGDIEIVARIRPDLWTTGSASDAVIIAKATAGQISYALKLTGTTGTLQFQGSILGTTTFTVLSSVATGFAAGATGWVKATLSISAGQVQFFTGPDAGTNVEPTYTQLGTNRPTVTTALFDGTAPLVVGDTPTLGAAFAGRVYRVIVRNGIGGTTVFDADFTQKPIFANSFVESSVNAATVTLNGALGQLGDGRVLVNSSTPGTAATLSNPSTGSFLSTYVQVQDNIAAGTNAPFQVPNASFSRLTNVTGWGGTARITPATIQGVASFPAPAVVALQPLHASTALDFTSEATVVEIGIPMTATTELALDSSLTLDYSTPVPLAATTDLGFVSSLTLDYSTEVPLVATTDLAFDSTVTVSLLNSLAASSTLDLTSEVFVELPTPPPSFVGSDSNWSAGNISLVIPLTVEAGDQLLIAAVGYNSWGAGDHFFVPTDWSAFYQSAAATGGPYPANMAVFRKTAVDGDAGTTVIIPHTGNTCPAALVAYTNTDYIEMSADGSPLSGSELIEPPTVTTLVNNELVVSVFGMFTSSPPVMTLPPNGEVTSSDPTFATVGFSDFLQAEAGLTDQVGAFTSVAGSSLGLTIVLHPAPIPSAMKALTVLDPTSTVRLVVKYVPLHAASTLRLVTAVDITAPFAPISAVSVIEIDSEVDIGVLVAPQMRGGVGFVNEFN
jgi:hypothetical protein